MSLHPPDGAAGEQGHHQQGQRGCVHHAARVWPGTQPDEGAGGLHRLPTLLSDQSPRG